LAFRPTKRATAASRARRSAAEKLRSAATCSKPQDLPRKAHPRPHAWCRIVVNRAGLSSSTVLLPRERQPTPPSPSVPR
jgi:hypothetical protein